MCWLARAFDNLDFLSNSFDAMPVLQDHSLSRLLVVAHLVNTSDGGPVAVAAADAVLMVALPDAGLRSVVEYLLLEVESLTAGMTVALANVHQLVTFVAAAPPGVLCNRTEALAVLSV